MLSQHDFLTAEESSRFYDTVLSLRKSWIDRAQGLYPFYTLGAASYLDATSKDDSEYRKLAQAMNPILKDNFAPLYEKLIVCLERIFKLSVSLADEIALPGFHIFLASRQFEKKGGQTHFDMQYQKIKWPYEQIDFENPISFTCAFALPQAGAGLEYWNLTIEMAEKMGPEAFGRFRMHQKPLYLPYEIGKLTLHRGLLMHQIASAKEVHPGDERITLQGHGLVCDGQLRLYW